MPGPASDAAGGRERRTPGASATTTPERSRLGELARVFLQLGAIGFGGPAAHIALMEEHVVRRRRWMSRGEFLDLLSAANLIPGPNSTELAIHVGYRRGGWRGIVVAGISFILPAALIVTAIAWAYVRFGEVPAVTGILYGVKPVVIAVVAHALWRLAGTAVSSRFLAILGVGALAATGYGVNEILVLLAAGVTAALLGRRHGSGGAASAGNDGRAALVVTAAGSSKSVALSALGGTISLGVAAAKVPVSLWALFAVFAKIGSLLFGSGYVLLAFLRSDFVTRLGWLTERQLLDAVAVGQVTPGPLFTSATFVGYLLAGWRGAAVATVGIFLPAFVFVALSAPLLPHLRRSATLGAALDGVNVASLALMAVVSGHLAVTALVDVAAIVIAVFALVLLERFRVNSVWLVAAGAAFGWATFR